MLRSDIRLFALLAPCVLATCYNRDGSPITDDTYQPCNNRDRNVASMCCGLRHQENNHTGIANDVCDPTGLCQNWDAADGNGQPPMIWWRQGCTDPTWQSPFCLKDVCAGEQYQSENAPVRNCSGGRWCCGDLGCCSTTASVFVLAATVGETSTSSPTPASTTASTTAAHTTADPTPPPTASAPPAQPATGLQTSAKVGIGVGVAIGVLALAAASLFWWTRRRRQRAETDGMSDELSQKTHATVYAQHGSPVELYSHDSPTELQSRGLPVEAGGTARAELEGSGPPA